MTDKAKKATAGTVLAIGGTLNIAVVAGFFYDAGIKASQIEDLRQKTNSHEAMIINTRQDTGDKLSELMKAVARIEGRLERMK